MFDTKRELRELLLKLALPLMVGHLAIIGLGITDIALSGHVSRHDLAGVMLGATLFDLPMMFVLGIFIANSTLVGRLHGRGDDSGLNAHFQDTLWLALPIGLVMAAGVQLMSLLVLPLLDAGADVKRVTASYLLPMTGTAFLLPMLVALRTTLESTGHPRVAMAFNIGGFLVNIPLDWALIHGWGPLPALGGAGCGWATLLVVTGIVLGLQLYIHKRVGLARLRFAGRLKRPSPRTMGSILLLGAPMGGAILAEAGFFHIIPMIAAKLGTVALAAHAIAMSFDMTLFIIPLAISQAVTIRTATALGKGERDTARRIALMGLKAIFLIAVGQCLLVLVLGGHIPALYSSDSAVTGLAASLLFVAAFIRIFDGVHIAGGGILRGYGDTRSILLISVSAFWLAGAPLAWLAARGHLGVGSSEIQAIWFAILAAVVLASAMTLWRVRVTLHRHR